MEIIKPDIHPLDLRDRLTGKFGRDWIGWLPEVLKKDITTDALLLNKIQALQVCFSTDSPWQDWHIFENVGKAFNDQIPNFAIMQPLSLGECLVTKRILDSLRNDLFSEEVLIYMATMAHKDQLVYIPNEPDIQAKLDETNIDHELKGRVEVAWDDLDDSHLMDNEYAEDDPVEQQLASLAILDQYLKENSGGTTNT